MTSNPLIKDIEVLETEFSKLMKKLVKDIKRQEKIMNQSDKRQRQEYDELQKRLEEVEKLQKSQKELLDSFIKLMAEAIDAKSPYTGGHCERVPEIAIMLAREASKDENIDFKITSEEEEREIAIAAWLHDCGKVVTPEYVVDKSTKLETIYNRIHEIRTRFEVIHRDLTIEALNKKLDGKNPKKVDEWLAKEHKRLQAEFEFIANANIGSEFMTQEAKDKVEKIAKRTWYRHFDKTLGLSISELKRTPKDEVLPVEEYLLADKPEHIIPRDEKEINELKQYNFKMDIPENLYNYGEVYNLNINRGTLTKEEFYKIQEHVIMTIRMLEQLPFPENLKNVPLYAGTHHEKLNGEGYPRGMTKEQLPIPSRIMVIADVFEALTASDRPYKAPKKLSEAIKILYFMVKDGEIDKDLFRIFLQSGIYLTYAKANLRQDQLDDIDVEYYLKNL